VRKLTIQGHQFIGLSTLDRVKVGDYMIYRLESDLFVLIWARGEISNRGILKSYWDKTLPDASSGVPTIDFRLKKV
jgi:hypothetical protein